MERYKNAILTYIQDETTYWSQAKWDKVNRNLKKWMNARDKHFVIDYFDDEDNKLCYAKRLFGCRLECFYEILKSTSQNKRITKIIKRSDSIVSFGCGPGPEIAAYICYVRSLAGCEYHTLDIRAVDCLEGWEDFIDSISDLDDDATVEFKKRRLSNKYLQKMSHCDVCIMSYPHAMNFDDIWANLKSKFTLIIFIDQAKGPLLQIARSHDFEFVDFQYNGQKTFFYYIDIDYYTKQIQLEKDIVEAKHMCDRGLHRRSMPFSSSSICEEEIKCRQVCGHKYTINCSDDIPLLINTLDYSIIKKGNVLARMSRRSGSSVKDNDNHSYLAIIDDDNDDNICQKLCNVVLECGHRCGRKCDSCLNGRLHRRCLEKCSQRLKCGHLFVDYCYRRNFRNCPVNCFKSRLKNIFRIKKKIPNKYMPQWTEEFSLPCLRMAGLNQEILQEIFSTRLYVEQRRCLKMSLMRLQKLFEFYDFLPNDSVPTRYKCYIDNIHRSIIAMTRWIWLEIKNINSTSFTEFDMEFERLKEIDRLYRMAKEGTKSKYFILPILNKLLVTKFSNELRIDICKQISDQ